MIVTVGFLDENCRQNFFKSQNYYQVFLCSIHKIHPKRHKIMTQSVCFKFMTKCARSIHKPCGTEFAPFRRSVTMLIMIVTKRLTLAKRLTMLITILTKMLTMVTMTPPKRSIKMLATTPTKRLNVGVTTLTKRATMMFTCQLSSACSKLR